MLAQSDPFRDLDAFFGRLAGRMPAGSAGAMDVYRRGTDVWIHLDVPGVAADSLEVTIERGVLTIAGERNWMRHEGDQLYLSERAAGPFRRQLHLGDGFDAEAIEADCHDGVLTLRIPLARQAQPRKITIGARGRAIEAGEAATSAA